MHSGLHLEDEGRCSGTNLHPLGKGLACIVAAMPTRPGQKPVLTTASQQPTGCRSYSPLEGRPAFARTRDALIAERFSRHQGLCKADPLRIVMPAITNRFEAFVFVMASIAKFKFSSPVAAPILNDVMTRADTRGSEIRGGCMQDRESHGKPIEELVSGLQTHLEQGLTQQEAQERLGEVRRQRTDGAAPAGISRAALGPVQQLPRDHPDRRGAGLAGARASRSIPSPSWSSSC